VPTALSAEFSQDKGKQAQWRAFVNKSKLDISGVGLGEVAAVLRDFLVPCTGAVAAGNKFEMEWPPSGPWQQIRSI
jgi:hypothetical protein